MSSKTSRPSSGFGFDSYPGKPPGAAKWCDYHRVNTHDTIECRAAKMAGVVKQSQADVKAAQTKKRNKFIRGIFYAEIARRRASQQATNNGSDQANPIAANTPGQRAPVAANPPLPPGPSAANDNANPQDAAKGLDADPKAAKASDGAG